MFANFFENLESRSLLSASVPTASVAHHVATPAAIHAAAKVVKAPTAKLTAKALSTTASSYTFTVTYSSTNKINIATIKTGNVTVTGPSGYSQVAKLVSTSPRSSSKTVTATYSITPVGSFAGGAYTVTLAKKSVLDLKKGTNTAAVKLGTISAGGSSTGSQGATAASLVGTYNGTLTIPAVNHYRNLVVTIASQNAAGAFTGSMVADGLVQLSVSGTVSSNGTFSFNFATPASGTPHAGGAISGTGSGTGAGTSSLAINITANAMGYAAPATISATKV